MSRALLIGGVVYLIGYLVCIIIIWAIHEDEREERGYIEPDTLDLFGRAFLAAAFISLIWFLLIPMYILVLAEKIAGRGEDD